ncbi:redox-regulated ATPase YchF, partial [Enterococcus faecium]
FDPRAFVGDVHEVLDVWRDLHLLTAKPAIYVCNVEEALAAGTGDNAFTKAVRVYAAKEGAQVLLLCCKLEEEISTMEPADRLEMITAL